MKLILCDLIWNLTILTILLLFSWSGFSRAYRCNRGIFYVGVTSIAYYSLASTRQLILAICLQSPLRRDKRHWKAKKVFYAMDSFIIPPLTIFATLVTRSNAFKKCYRNDTSVHKWIIVNMYITVGYGFVFTAYLFCVWYCACM